MKLTLYSLLFFFLNLPIILGQQVLHVDQQINQLVKDYQDLFVHSNLVMDTIINELQIKQPGLLNNLLKDQQLNKIQFTKRKNVVVSKSSFSDLGLKWVSDATHNFSPGISENEDVYFRSRFSTGIDWVVLGEGSWVKGKKEYNLFRKQIQMDSLRIHLQNNMVSLQNRLTILQHVFDQHRLNLLRKYERILQNQSIYWNHLYHIKLSSYADKLTAEQQLEEIQNAIELYEIYQEYDLDEAVLKTYWNLPFDNADLPALNLISEQELLKEEEDLLELQKEILISNEKSSNLPSLRFKLRYNYYDTADQPARSFSNIGASLSIPIHFGKESSKVAYQLASYEDNLDYKKQQLKNKLIVQHREFYILKKRVLQIDNELHYLQALLKNEMEVYTDENESFSPAKYIDYTEQFIQKNLALLEVKQKLSEAYLVFGSLYGLNTVLLEDKRSNTELRENKQSTYMWKSYFETHSNEQLINSLKKNEINRLFLSPGRNDVKAKDFVQKAKQQGIETDRLIGENSFAERADGVDKLIQKLESVKLHNFSGIHLNIEPHTFDDYKENKEKYIQRMNEIYTTAKQWCNKNNVKLSVSVPLHLPTENAIVLARNKIDAYIMAYETTDQIKLLKRTETLRNTLQGGFIWVLRLSDFTNKAMLHKTEEILKNTGIERIGYYDFSALNDFPQ